MLDFQKLFVWCVLANLAHCMLHDEAVLVLDYEKAEELAQFPFKCYQKESPHLNETIVSSIHRVLLDSM